MAKNNVDGVYDDDPRRNPQATRYDILSYQVAIERNLRVMDASALTLCRDNDVPIIVFNVQEAGNIQRAARGDTIGTLVCSDPVAAPA
jgi:uridylate kinase